MKIALYKMNLTVKPRYFLGILPLVASALIVLSAQGADDLLPQPKALPGPWELATNPLPLLKDILAQPADPLPVYGLYVWANQYLKFREEVRAVGWKSLRIGGPLNDSAMKAVAEEGLEVMKTLQIGNLDGEQNRDRTAYASDEQFINAARDSAVSFLDRYGPAGSFFRENPGVPPRPVSIVEIWNEPDYKFLIPGAPGKEIMAERERLYAQLLPVVYRAVKQKAPAVRVIGFSTGGGVELVARRFTQNVHADSPAVASANDILSTHPYNNNAGPEMRRVKPWADNTIQAGVESMRRTMIERAGAAKPVWFTEVGWQISQADGGEMPRRADKVEKDYVSPLLQAAYDCRLYALALRLGVPRVHLMFLVDTDGFNGGMFRHTDHTWRPVAHAIQNQIRIMPNPKLVDAVSDGVQGYYCYTFLSDHTQPGAKPVTMAWNVTGPQVVSLPVAETTVRLTDMLGHSRTLTAERGTVKVPVGPYPVYLQQP